MASEDTAELKELFGDTVDLSTFEQILDMDDGDENREFSKSIVFGFFDQARETFENMDAAIIAKDLPKLSSLGHFLKGSSATLGFTHIKDECEKIQNYGNKRDETGSEEFDDEERLLVLIRHSVTMAEASFDEIEGRMRKYFAD